MSAERIFAEMFRRLSIALLAVVVSAPLSAAQMRGWFARGGRGGIGLHHGMRSFGRGTLLGSPFFYSDSNASEPYIEESAPPQVVIVQSTPDDSQTKAKSEPLLIEWQGDRYVRFGGVETAAGSGMLAHHDYAQPAIRQPTSNKRTTASARRKESAESQPAKLPATVLIYRDGHREEIAAYSIVGGVIYIHGDYWQNGYWTKKVPLSALDAPATVRANRDRGVRFLLPSAPNVVIASF